METIKIQWSGKTLFISSVNSNFIKQVSLWFPWHITIVWFGRALQLQQWCVERENLGYQQVEIGTPLSSKYSTDY